MPRLAQQIHVFYYRHRAENSNSWKDQFLRVRRMFCKSRWAGWEGGRQARSGGRVVALRCVGWLRHCSARLKQRRATCQKGYQHEFQCYSNVADILLRACKVASQNFTQEKRYPFLRILLYFVKHNFLQMVLMSLLFIFVNLSSSFTVCKNHS